MTVNSLYNPVYVSLANDPKMYDLKQRVNLTRRDTIGLLTLFWLWCVVYAPDGCLTGKQPDRIATWCEWEGSGAELLKHLRDAGWLDGDNVHDWNDYGGKVFENREKNAQRVQKWRDNHKSPATIQSKIKAPSLPPAPKPVVTREPAPEQDDALASLAVMWTEELKQQLTPAVAHLLKDAITEYPSYYFLPAFQDAAAHNARSWAYIESILNRWKANSFTEEDIKNEKRKGKGSQVGTIQLPKDWQ